MANESFGARAGRAVRRVPGQVSGAAKSTAGAIRGADQAVTENWRDFVMSSLDAEPEAVGTVAPGTGPLAQPQDDWTAYANPDILRGALLEDQPAPRMPAGQGMLRTTDPQLRATQDAAEATRLAAEAKAAEEEQIRQTYRAFKDPKTGVWNLNNTDGGGEVVLGADNRSAGPDIGAAGRGGVSFGGGLNDPMKDPAYRNYLAMGDRLDEETKEDADTALYELLAKNPYAKEYLLNEQAMQREQAATNRALLGRQWDAQMLGREADLEAERDDAYRTIDSNGTLTPEQKAEAKAVVDREVQLEGLRSGIKPRQNPLG